MELTRFVLILSDRDNFIVLSRIKIRTIIKKKSAIFLLKGLIAEHILSVGILDILNRPESY